MSYARSRSRGRADRDSAPNSEPGQRRQAERQAERPPLFLPSTPLPSNKTGLEIPYSTVLEGTEDTFASGWLKWKDGAVFLADSNSKARIARPGSTAHREFGAIAARLMQGRFTLKGEGASNNFHELPAAIDDAGVRAFVSRSKDGDTASLGIRINQDGFTEEQEVYQAWEEAWVTLSAAVLGIGPPVYGVSLYRGHAIMITERGLAFDKWLRQQDYEDEDFFEPYAASLDALMKKTAEANLLLIDMKPQNTIVLRGEVLFIDFGGDFCKFVKPANSECVEFLNSTLLLSHMYCWDASDASRAVIQTLRGKVETWAKRDRMAESLCRLVNTLAGRDYEYSATGAFSLTDELKLAKHIVAIAMFYSARLDKNGELKDELFGDCRGNPYSHGDAAWPSIINNALDGTEV